ncbi:acetyltransferase [Streptomyces laurentii]|jgi:ribosomal protein S18 acetylase RimI-like enzyme|uniref:Acetyltransferase n=1 Tax=Streptomyces laurentii TaxID=39478 RepID=A0A160NVS2_STRLU|nr:acetyltransferase [Streptomyces laurentii]
MGMSVTISAADATRDAEQILKLQYLCYQREAEIHQDWSIEPLTQPLDALRAELVEGVGLVARLGEEIVASVRGRLDADGTVRIDRLIVHPRMRRHGLGGRLLDAIERHFAAEPGPAAKRFRLSAGRRGEAGLRLYHSRGYAQVGPQPAEAGLAQTLVTLEKAA